MKYVAAGMNPMDLKRGIDQAISATIDELRKISKPCNNEPGNRPDRRPFRQFRCGYWRHHRAGLWRR